MPKIKITEIDNTGVASLSSIPNVVYIPGKAVGTTAVASKLFTTASEFKKDIAKYTVDKSTSLAYQLLKLGMQVVFEGFASNVTAVSDNSIMALTDKNNFDIRFITAGASGLTVNPGAMIACAYKRTDAVAIVDCASEDVATIRAYVEFGQPDSGDPGALYTAVKTALGGAVTDEEVNNAMSFGAMFTPTCKVSFTGITADGKEKVESEFIPASFAYLLAYATSTRTNAIWKAVAGSYRGIIPGLIKTNKSYSSAEVEILQARAKDGAVALDEAGDNLGVAVNPISVVRPFGPVVYGNRTLRCNLNSEGTTSGGTGVLKATSFLNCRVLSTEVSKVCYNTAKRYQFEQNNLVLWTNIIASISPTLDSMVNDEGIMDWTPVKLPTDKKARIAMRIDLTPIEAVEDFDITINLTDNVSVVAE